MANPSIPREPAGFGFVTESADLTWLAEHDIEALRRLIATCGVAVFRHQTLDDDAFVTVLERLGPMTFTPGETPLPGQSKLNAVSNLGRSTPPRSVFHTDSSYFDAPPAFTALRAVSVPESGGATLFADQYAAAECLSRELHDQLIGRTMRHTVTGLSGRSEAQVHPILRRHPITQREALYLSTPERCDAISGMAPEASRELIETLYEHSIEPTRLFRHRWQPGDVVIWDDRCTLHKADHADTVGDRVLHRGMVAGEVPIPA